jgi:hypothetical protein
MKKLFAILGSAALMAALGVAAGQKFADLKVTVLRNSNGKPIRNASVVLHPVDDKGRQSNSGLQLKTNAEGEAGYPSIPYGKLRIQVIAPGFQTYGEDFDISQPTHEIVVKLKRPQEQYSIYGNEKKPPEKKEPPK